MAVAPRTFEAYEQALMSEQPLLELRAVAKRFVDEGVPREQILDEFGVLLDRLHAEHRDADEDVVRDVGDFVDGFSSSWMRV
jgi:hypothetical protein